MRCAAHGCKQVPCHRRGWCSHTKYLRPPLHSRCGVLPKSISIDIKSQQAEHDGEPVETDTGTRPSRRDRLHATYSLALVLLRPGRRQRGAGSCPGFVVLLLCLGVFAEQDPCFPSSGPFLCLSSTFKYRYMTEVGSRHFGVIISRPANSESSWHVNHLLAR